MLQKLIPILLILLPTAAYVLWMAATARRGRPVPAGPDADAEQPAAASQSLFADAPWPWLIGGGLVLAMAGFAWLAFQDGAPPGSVYVPARVVDGEVQPGFFITPEDQAQAQAEARAAKEAAAEAAVQDDDTETAPAAGDAAPQ